MMKKLTSILLALVMALTLCGTTWGEETNIENNDVTSQTTAADMPMLLSASTPVSVTPTYEWYGDGNATEYVINSLSDYLGFAKLTQGKVGTNGITSADFNGKTVKLGADIDFAGIDFLYRDSDGNIVSDWRVETFYGTFDGQDYTIKNVVYKDECTSGRCGMALFRTVVGTIKNLKVDTITATAINAPAFGGVVLQSHKNDSQLTGIYNCHVNNATLTATGTADTNDVYIGGLAGFVKDYKEVKSCSVTNFTVTTANRVAYLGGLIGWFYIGAADKQAGELSNCSVTNFTANIAGAAGRGEGASGNFGGIGGMLGYGHSGNSNYAFPIKDCTVENVNITVGKAYNMSYIGGFLGMSRRRYAAENCVVNGGTISVTSADDSKQCAVGGFCGAPTGGESASWAQNADGSTISFKNCSADVTIDVKGSCVAGSFAGIVGSFFQPQDVSQHTATFNGCATTGAVNGEKEVGSFIGKTVSGKGTYNSSITSCTVNGEATTDEAFFGDETPTDVRLATLTLNLNGGTGVEAVTQIASGSVNLENYRPTKKGHTFGGWLDADGTKIQATTLTLSEDTTLNASWSANEYNITYNLDGGTNATSNPTKYTYGVGVPSFAAPTKSGHTFKGWVNSENVVVTSIETDEIDGITLTATWEKNKTPYRVNPNATPTETVESPKTFDAGIAVYGVMAISSVLGMGYVGKKKF